MQTYGQIINNIEKLKDKEILKLYFIENMPIKALCKKLKTSDKYLYAILNYYGLP